MIVPLSLIADDTIVAARKPTPSGILRAFKVVTNARGQAPLSGFCCWLLFCLFFSKGLTLQRYHVSHLKISEMYVGMIFNGGAGSLKHISFQYAKGERLVSEWFHSAGEKHFLNLKR